VIVRYTTVSANSERVFATHILLLLFLASVQVCQWQWKKFQNCSTDLRRSIRGSADRPWKGDECFPTNL